MTEPGAIQTASIGIPDTLFLMLLALVVFGPRRLPEIGRQIGKLMYEFRKVSNDFKFQMEEELRASEETARLEKLRVLAPAPQPQPILEGNTEEASIFTPTHSTPMLEATTPATELDADSDVSAEQEKFPSIQPPSTGEIIAAQKPFRGRIPETEPDPVTVADTPETTPEVKSEAEQEAHHG